MYFLLTLFTDNFPKTIHPKCAPDRSISISKMQKLLRLGGGTPPLPDPLPARALRALACVFPTILQILPPHEIIPAYGLAKNHNKGMTAGLWRSMLEAPLTLTVPMVHICTMKT